MFGWFKSKQPAIAAPSIVIKSEPLPQTKDQFIHLGIVVGHDKKEQGAVMDHQTKMTEYLFNKGLANKILAIADQQFPKLKVSVILRDGQGIHGAYQEAKNKNCDAVIELHFNASANKQAKGTVTLCTPDLNDVEFAHVIHSQICKVFNRAGESMGVVVVGKSVRGAPNVYAFPEGVNCLLEPFFGDTEAADGIAKEEECAKAILQAVMTWGMKKDLIKTTSGQQRNLP